MMLVKSSVATTQKRVHSPMDTGSTFSSSSTLFRITPLIRATRACEQTKKSYVHWDLLKIYKQWQCYRQIRLRTTRQLLCSRARALSHLCCTPVHSLASIFLDGTVRKCNGPTALLQCACKTHTVARWRKLLLLYFSPLHEMCTGRWRHLRPGTWCTLCRKPRRLRMLHIIRIDTLGTRPCEYNISTTKLSSTAFFFSSTALPLCYHEIGARLALLYWDKKYRMFHGEHVITSAIHLASRYRQVQYLAKSRISWHQSSLYSGSTVLNSHISRVSPTLCSKSK